MAKRNQKNVSDNAVFAVADNNPAHNVADVTPEKGSLAECVLNGGDVGKIITPKLNAAKLVGKGRELAAFIVMLAIAQLRAGHNVVAKSTTKDKDTGIVTGERYYRPISVMFGSGKVNQKARELGLSCYPTKPSAVDAVFDALKAQNLITGSSYRWSCGGIGSNRTNTYVDAQLSKEAASW